ncbi:MAG: hypothetical protein AAF682_31630 [Planctomycetota bacterium]
MGRSIGVLLATLAMLLVGANAGRSQGYCHMKVSSVPTGSTLTCASPCPNDTCSFWVSSLAGESCKCTNTIQVNCCDLYLEPNGVLHSIGLCAAAGCPGAAGSTCRMLTLISYHPDGSIKKIVSWPKCLL